jgi:DNA invertase Pin-like site-specific DNA recombinase
MKRVAIYLRVSTDKQTINNQRRELEAVAERQGSASRAGRHDEGGQRERVRHGRFLVS